MKILKAIGSKDLVSYLRTAPRSFFKLWEFSEVEFTLFLCLSIVHTAVSFDSENVLVKHTFILISLWLFSFCEFDAFSWSPWPVISKYH